MTTLRSWARSFVPKKDPSAVMNPFKFLKEMDWQAWALLIAGWAAWTVDGYDYFSVSLTAPLLSKQFDRPLTDITSAITITLTLRSIGAIIFGILADRFGRKWTLVGNLCLIGVFSLSTGFSRTFKEFLGIRAIFGIAMGGIWGQAAATGLESVPVAARGFCSGWIQQGYAVGYLVAALVNLYLVPKQSHSWRAIYWVGGGISFAVAIYRALLPESRVWQKAKEEERLSGTALSTGEKSRIFLREFKAMIKTHYLTAIWAVGLMTGMNFLSHGSQDLGPSMWQITKGFSSKMASRTTIYSNLGAIAGGMFFGWLSQYSGRRLAMIIALLWTACFIPLWLVPSGYAALTIGATLLQFGVQGCWGVIPVYLNESSPPAFRALFAGLAYQLGNLVSSAAAQIEARGGENFRVEVRGKEVADYAKVSGILIGTVIAWTLIMTLIGPENKGAHFEDAHVATVSGAGREKANDLIEPVNHVRDEHAMEDTTFEGDYKGSDEHIEKSRV